MRRPQLAAVARLTCPRLTERESLQIIDALETANAVTLCNCVQSDAWRCAVARGVTTSVACHCSCHHK